MREPFTSESAFSRCADVILDALEDVFDTEPKTGRSETKTALINLLAYFCAPLKGEMSITEHEKQIEVLKRAGRQ